MKPKAEKRPSLAGVLWHISKKHYFNKICTFFQYLLSMTI